MKRKIIIYGIKNCDTMKKTFDWFDERNISYEFHNYKTEGISADKIESWLKQIPLETLVNKKGTTFRSLNDKQKKETETGVKAVGLMTSYTSLIKRPVIEIGRKILIGFDSDGWEKELTK